MKRFTTVWQTLLTLCLLLLTLQGQAAPVVQFIHTDALGSPIAATGDQGQLLWREEYQPFGERIIQDTASGSRKSWYTGHIEDQDTGLIYMGARFYDPQIGRFLSIDPVGFSNDNPMQFNRYAYANNNPYRYTDPSGAIPVETVWDVANIGMGAVSFGKNWAVGNYIGAAVDAVGILVDTATTAIPYLPGGAGTAIKTYRLGDGALDVTNTAGKAGTKADDVIHVTKEGVALPPGQEYKIPDNYVQNPHNRTGSYGEIENGKFRERLRIDPATPPGQKGPNYSHYHLNGKGTHYSPRPVDKDPGFGQ